MTASSAPAAPPVLSSAGFAKAHGAPCPTVVLDGRALPASDPQLLGVLAALRTEMTARGAGHILKNAIISPSRHPLFDLDYRFVQSLPGAMDSFDLRGSCGHSILAAVEAAARTGMIQPLVPGCRVRVNVLNNGDNVVCETEETSDGGTRFTAHFLCSPPKPLPELLSVGEPVSHIAFDGRTVPVSLVSMGNPYIFVPAAELGAGNTDELFADDPALFERMLRLRLAVCETYGWDSAGAFPKIAALLPDGPEALAVRAVSVPSWHPTVALTGAVCLGSAAEIEGTVPWQLASGADRPEGLLCLRTTRGPLRVAASTTGSGGDQRLSWVSVAEKQVDYQGRLPAPEPAPPGTVTETSPAPRSGPPTTSSPPEETPWLSLTV